MSGRDDGRQIFVEEARDQLRQLEQGLLALESKPGDREAMNALFRAAHTIKGSAGLFGFSRLVSFTHVLENVLDRVRAGVIALDRDLAQLALECGDHVGAIIQTITASGRDDQVGPEVTSAGSALLARLQRALEQAREATTSPVGGATPAALAAPVTAAPAPTAALAAPPAPRRASRPGWHVCLRLAPEAFQRGLDPIALIQYLGTLGSLERVLTVSDGLPGLSELDPGRCYLGFEILMGSERDEATLEAAFDLVRDVCHLAIFAPGAPLARYAELARALPEGAARAGATWVEAGALTGEELAAMLALTAVVHPEMPPVATAGASAAAAQASAAQASAAQPTAAPAQATSVPTQTSAPTGPTASAAAVSTATAPNGGGTAAPSRGGAPAGGGAGRSGDASRFLRVSADKLDRLITLVGELVIAGSAASTLARERGDSRLREAAATVDGLVEEIREGAMRLRMVPLGETFNRFQRVVRDVSSELGKQIGLVVSGGDTELDKSVVEQMTDPLTHLVRNAMDHGIEDPQTRQRAGKPPGGTLRLHAYHDSGSVVIQVSDDGRGLDRARILAKAHERGLVDPNRTLSDEEILKLIFEPGFSTAEKVTNLSGRGVGMDVVRRNISELRGTVALASEPGAGTTITIRLPLTLAIIDGFLVKVGPASYVVPLEAVFECIELPAGSVAQAEGGDYLSLRGQVLPLLRLREVFRLPGPAPRRQSVVVLQNGTRRAGLVVDQLLGEHQTVIKPLGKLFASVPGLSGSTVLGTGEVALILDVIGLVARAERASGGPGGNKHGGRGAAQTGSDKPEKGYADASV